MLVPLAEQQHRVAGPCESHGGADRLAPVGYELRLGSPGDEAGGDVLEDQHRILAAGVFIGQDHDVGVLGGDPALHRPLLSILFACGTEHDDDTAVHGGISTST